VAASGAALARSIRRLPGTHQRHDVPARAHPAASCASVAATPLISGGYVSVTMHT
jgi:hypothetical protein